MWLDNASEVDILFYEPYADVIADIVCNKTYNPLTIGVFGVWGAGKSTLLNLVQQKVDEKTGKSKKTICFTINAWTFEGYEDAKIALMEALLRELKENKSVPEKVKEGVIGLLKRVDYFKLATKAISVGAPIVASAVTMNPIPALMSAPVTVETIGKGVASVADNIKTMHDDYLKDSEESVVSSVRKFKEEFAKTLSDDEIDNVIVLIDDLDRCQPDSIIETLEAIKLFLSVPKMSFIVAADENVIQYAIRKKYPPVGNYAVNLDREYIEKIIQLPIYIPELSTKDIENYLLFLVVQEYCSSDNFNKFLSDVKESGLIISDNVIDSQTIKESASKYIDEDVRGEFENNITVISGIKSIVAGNLKGNPRQTKRFLNTYVTKKKLAELYYGKDSLNIKILAKLLVLQKLDSDLFIQLNEWNKRFTTENEDFKKMKLEVLSDDGEQGNYKSWSTPTIIKWLQCEPQDLEKTNLDKYFYLTRESLKKSEVDISSLSGAAKDILERIGNATQGLIRGIIEDFEKLSATDQAGVFSVLLPKIAKGEIKLYITREIFVSFEAYREKLCEALERVNEKIQVGGISSLKAMRNVDETKIDNLLDVWLRTNTIDQKTVDIIKGRK
ncbi:KAP family P-loop NTPase fold protein [Lachnobacterium bovis]|uniref:KAP family P-loop NTPase fold protein n=1 Tax=Lachnobacterium bovis TaxID=140626 RepID=UPI0004913977|nr:P-loop NTPase fold protein [Lachnobacterium bovis]